MAQPKTRWWQLYALGLLLIGLLAIDHQLDLPPLAHTFLQVGTVVLVSGLMLIWIKANEAGFRRRTAKDYALKIKIYEPARKIEMNSRSGQRASPLEQSLPDETKVNRARRG